MTALHIRGARIGYTDHRPRDLFIKDGRFVAAQPARATNVDLDGYRIIAGWINAHDHLELNHYPRTKFREVYDNAHQWGEDVDARLDDVPFKTLRAYPLRDRLFIGGLKNLLCGALTVVQHGAKHRELFRRDYPVRVLKDYGWAHSLHFDSDEEIVHSYRATPQNWPWFIHLAEGTDATAQDEYRRLKALSCVRENTVIVHGVGLDLNELESDFECGQRIRGIVTCPSTNLYLLGKTLNLSEIDLAPDDLPIAPASDSRLTADGDWLDELSAFASVTGISLDAHALDGLQRSAARIVWGTVRDPFAAGESADFVVIRDGAFPRKRHEIAAIVREGVPQIGDSDVMAHLTRAETIACTLDTATKRIAIPLARQEHHCTLKEAGLEIDALPRRQRRWFF